MQNPAAQSVVNSSQIGASAGSCQNRKTNSAAPAMQKTQVRCARPLSHLSVAQPAKSMPRMPAISNIATSHPACDIETPFDWLSSEGPQSSTEKRTM